MGMFRRLDPVQHRDRFRHELKMDRDEFAWRQRREMNEDKREDRARELRLKAQQQQATAAQRAADQGLDDPLAFVPKDETPRAMVKFNQLRAQKRDVDFATAVSGEDSGSFWLAQHGWKTDASRTLARVDAPKAK